MEQTQDNVPTRRFLARQLKLAKGTRKQLLLIHLPVPVLDNVIWMMGIGLCAGEWYHRAGGVQGAGN